MVKKLITLLIGATLCISLAGCGSGNSAKGGTDNIKEPDTITIAWLPNNSGDDFKDFRAEYDKIISDATGKKVEDKLTTDYDIAIAALDSGDAQLGYFGPYEYLTGRAKNTKIVPLVVESGDSGTLDDALYHSRLLVKKGNEDKYKSGGSYSIDNIAGEKMSFVSTSSTSGFNMPASAILGYFNQEDKWKNLTKDDLMQGGNNKFFSQTIFAGSHQLSLVTLLTDKADVAAVDDIDVAQYVDLTSGNANEEGSVYTVKKDAAAPFNTLGGDQYVVIKSIPVQNTPLEANSSVLSQKTLDAITNALTSDKVTSDTKIFAPKGSKGSVFVEPHRFLKADDSWYDPMRKVLNIGA